MLSPSRYRCDRRTQAVRTPPLPKRCRRRRGDGPSSEAPLGHVERPGELKDDDPSVAFGPDDERPIPVGAAREEATASPGAPSAVRSGSPPRAVLRQRGSNEGSTTQLNGISRLRCSLTRDDHPEKWSSTRHGTRGVPPLASLGLTAFERKPTAFLVFYDVQFGRGRGQAGPRFSFARDSPPEPGPKRAW